MSYTREECQFDQLALLYRKLLQRFSNLFGIDLRKDVVLYSGFELQRSRNLAFRP